jgi:hypothetical protein
VRDLASVGVGGPWIWVGHEPYIPYSLIYSIHNGDDAPKNLNNDASRAFIHQYENLQRRIYNYNANIYFN